MLYFIAALALLNWAPNVVNAVGGNGKPGDPCYNNDPAECEYECHCGRCTEANGDYAKDADGVLWHERDDVCDLDPDAYCRCGTCYTELSPKEDASLNHWPTYIPDEKACVTNEQCASGFCSNSDVFKTDTNKKTGCGGTCKALLEAGGVCSDEKACKHGQCQCEQCTDENHKSALGQKCSTNDNCVSGWCQDPEKAASETVGCLGVCTAKKANGDNCVGSFAHPLGDDESCESGYCGNSIGGSGKCEVDPDGSSAIRAAVPAFAAFAVMLL